MGRAVPVRDRHPVGRHRAPTSEADFEEWVVQGPLGPASALFREGAVLLQEQPELADTRLYYSVLSAIVRGRSRRSEIAAALGRSASVAQAATLACREHRCLHELDVVVAQKRPFEPDLVSAIGAVKCTGRPVGEAELIRLEHLRELLPADRVADPPRLLIFSRAGFTPAVTRAASGRGDVELIDLDRLYHGG